MSNNGWGACSSCHPFGLTDNVVWIFGSGPRRTIPQHTDFDLTEATRSRQRALNWSAIFDEEEDFELNIRGVSGGQGIIVAAGTSTPEGTVAAFTPANAGRPQLTVNGVGGWNAIKAFVQFGIRPPISPVSKTDPEVIAGRALFTAANCQQCHGGAQWTSSRVRYTPPPGPGVVVGGQIIGELRQVGTFDPTFFNEVRADGTPPLGADGFNPASLLSIFAFPESFLHNGAQPSLDDVLDNVTHRSAGTGGVDTLTNPADRAFIVRFLQSIDAATTPIP
jgi:cytochrome c peroxidase